MAEIQLGIAESRFADMIWEKEPVSTSELVKLAEATFSWKRTTTHTVVKRLCEKGLFVNNKGVVTSVIKRDQFYSLQSEKIVEDNFSGSLPAFIAAFTRNKKLSDGEISECDRVGRGGDGMGLLIGKVGVDNGIAVAFACPIDVG